MKRLLLWLLLSAAAMALLSCSGAYRLNRDRLATPSAWPFIRGDLAGSGARIDAAFSGRLTLDWERSYTGKPGGPLTIYHNTVIVPDVRRRVYYFETDDGALLGKTKLNGPAQTGVVIRDSVALVGVGPSKDEIRAVNLVRNKVLWEQDFRDANPGPILVGERLIASSRMGILRAWRLSDGEVEWTHSADSLFTAPPSYADGRVFQPGDPGMLHVIDADSGTELYHRTLGSSIVSPVSIVDGRVYVALLNGTVFAVNADDGTTIWQTALDGPSWTAPTVGDGRVIVGNSKGQVTALDAETGAWRWQYDAGAVLRASALVVGKYVVIATYLGALSVLQADNGRVVDTTSLDGTVQYPPVTDGRCIYVATQNGRLYCFGDANERTASRADAHDGQGVRASYRP